MDIGIIGGADGPTAIFIASRSPMGMIGALIVICIAVVVIVRVIMKRKNKE